MAAPGEKSFYMLEYHKIKSLVAVHFVQSTQKNRLQTRPFEGGINNLPKLGVCASRKHICWRVCGKNLNIVSMCAVSHPRCTHRTSLVVKKKNFFSFPVAVNNSIKVGPLIFLL